jgi:hypothetical protein
MAAKKISGGMPPKVDPGLEQIDDLERDIVLGKEQLWTANGVSAEEIARERPAVVALAKAVTDRMRAEYRARSPQP